MLSSVYIPAKNRSTKKAKAFSCRTAEHSESAILADDAFAALIKKLSSAPEDVDGEAAVFPGEINVFELPGLVVRRGLLAEGKALFL